MQEAEFQFFTNSVMNELTYGRKVTPELSAEIECLLRDFGMWEFRNRHPFTLSGGQMQKLTLLLAFLSEKPMAILDEPTAGLDGKSLENCVKIIERMRKSKIGFIITHDLELISKVCNRCICLADGRMERVFHLNESGGLEELRTHMECTFRSVKTRGLFKTSGEKLHALPEYLEIMVVPMAFRVIRIAEALSASAETRGIDLKRKRSSYISLKFGTMDIIMAVLLILALTAGFLL